MMKFKSLFRRHGASTAPVKAEGGAGPSMVDVDVAVGLQQLAKEKASLEARVTDLLGVEREVHTLREKVRALQVSLLVIHMSHKNLLAIFLINDYISQSVLIEDNPKTCRYLFDFVRC